MQQTWRLVTLLKLFSFGVPTTTDHSPLTSTQSLNNTGDRFGSKRPTLNTPQMITFDGYPVEVSLVTTADGYLLEMHRIPHGKGNKVRNGPAVLLMHGILVSSADWVLPGPKRGLAYILADEGFDVWMGNFRGNLYSRRHIMLDPSSTMFWRFSWDQMAEFDLPALIEKVLETTHKKKIHYVGHSMGTTVFLGMPTFRPDLMDKIFVAGLLAPTAYMTHNIAPLRHFGPMKNAIMTTSYDVIGNGEFMKKCWLMDKMVSFLCNEDWMPKGIPGICTNIMFMMTGYNPVQMDNRLTETILHHYPCGSSVQAMMHFIQLMTSDKFAQFDFGYYMKNVDTYGTKSPPEYNISAVTAPVITVWGDNDWFVQPKDIGRLVKELPNLVQNYKVPFKGWIHQDFIWGKDAPKLVYPVLLNHMRRHTNDRSEDSNKSGRERGIQSTSPTLRPTSNHSTQSTNTAMGLRHLMLQPVVAMLHCYY